MKKVLLVSPYPYSRTGRGMDVLTECFEESDWETHHLQFPNVFYSVSKTRKFTTNVKEFYSGKALVPYVDSVMKWFPRWLFNLMCNYQNNKVKGIRLGDYDYIVLESGKPLFLLNIIPEKTRLIYRQSDSVRHVLGKNKYYIQLEDLIYERAEKIITVKDRFKSLLPKHIQAKTNVIRNGYSIPEELNLENPYAEQSKNAIYVGLTKLDYKTIKTICMENPELDTHIFGACLNKKDLLKLRKLKNFHYYGFQPRDMYLSYIKYADVAIFPFKAWDAMKWVGFTTKYLNFMYYNLPIVSYLTGERSEFEGMGVHFAVDPDDFSKKISDILISGERGNAQIDFHFFSHGERKKEYKDFISSLQ